MKVLPPSRPFARGVSQLMYVGDDDAVDNAVSNKPTRGVIIVLGVIAAWFLLRAHGRT